MVPSARDVDVAGREPDLGRVVGVEDQVGPGLRQVEGLEVARPPGRLSPTAAGRRTASPSRAVPRRVPAGAVASVQLWPSQMVEGLGDPERGPVGADPEDHRVAERAADAVSRGPAKPRKPPTRVGPVGDAGPGRLGALGPATDQPGRLADRRASPASGGGEDDPAGRVRGGQDGEHRRRRRPRRRRGGDDGPGPERPSAGHRAPHGHQPDQAEGGPDDDVEAEGRVDGLGRGHRHQAGRAGQGEAEVAARPGRRRRGPPGSRVKSTASGPSTDARSSARGRVRW